MNASTISRRRLLQGGAALLATPLLAPHLSWAGVSGAATQPLLWVAQPDIAASVAYAAGVRREQVLTLSDRIEHLLYRELVPALRSRPVGLTGVTDAATLFCIETVASDHGLRMARRTAIAASSPASGPSAANQEQLFSWLMLPRRQAHRSYSEVSV